VLFSWEQLLQGIENIVSGITYATARPISYTLSVLEGNIIEIKSTTDEISHWLCVAKTQLPLLNQITVKIRTGKKGRMI